MGIPWRRALWPLAAALLAALAWAGTAGAAVIAVNPGGPGQVELNKDRFVPGDTITLNGSGFTSYTGSAGDPILAVKINSGDLPPGWTFGGPDALSPAEVDAIVGEDVAAFKVRSDGSFSGWIEIPAGQGPWELHLRFLGGGFGTASPAVNAKKLVPTSYTHDIAIVERLTTGFTNTGVPPAFFPGTTLPSTGGALTLRGAGFTSGEAVTASVDGTPVTLSGTTVVDGDGLFEATAMIPAGLGDGTHTLTVTDGTITETKTLRVVSHAVTVLTPKVRPGGLIAVDATGFVGIAGTGQGLALNLAGTVINFDEDDPASVCPRADGTGAALVTGVVPSGTAAGAKALNVLAGRECIAGGTPVVTDPFGRNGAATVEIDPAAPVVTPAAATVTAGTRLVFTAQGFEAGRTVTVRFDRTVVGTLTADGAGKVAGSIPVRGTTAPGAHVLVLTTPEPAGAAARVQVAAAPAAKATITGGNPAPGGALNVSLSGFLRDDAEGGQRVAFKVDGGGPVLACIATDAAGAGAGTVPLPADLAPGAHVLNVLAGTACGDGTQPPGRSLQVPFAVPAPPAPPAPPAGGGTTPPAKKRVTAPALKTLTLANRGKRVKITLRKATPVRTVVTVTTAAKVKLKPRAKAAVLTLAKGVVKARGKVVTVALTAKGKRYLAGKAKGARVRVKVIRAPKGGVRATQTLTLRVAR